MKEFLNKYFTLIITFIFVVLGLYYYGRAYGCEDLSFKYEDQVYIFEHPLAIFDMHEELKTPIYFSARENDDRKTYAQKVKFHQREAERTYKQAKEKCWYLPDLSEREKARYCITSIGIGLAPMEPASKSITILVNALIQYTIDCCDEWHYINEKLYWSHYHYEMMEFYQEVIKQGYT